MNPAAALLVIVLLVAATTGLGLIWHRRQGRVARRAGASGTVTVSARELGIDPSVADTSFGDDATLLQFSTEFCAKCPGTSTLLRQLADARTGVRHVDVDLTHRADLARRFNVLQTPTTLVLDGAGRVRARVGGVPNRAALNAELDALARAPRAAG